MYRQCTFGVPSSVLYCRHILPSVMPYLSLGDGKHQVSSTLTRWVCQQYACSLATACLQYGCSTTKPTVLRYYPKTQQLWQGNRAIPRAANSATRYITTGTDVSANALCPHMWPTRRPKRSRLTAATSRWSPNSRPT